MTLVYCNERDRIYERNGPAEHFEFKNPTDTESVVTEFPFAVKLIQQLPCCLCSQWFNAAFAGLALFADQIVQFFLPEDESATL